MPDLYFPTSVPITAFLRFVYGPTAYSDSESLTQWHTWNKNNSAKFSIRYIAMSILFSYACFLWYEPTLLYMAPLAHLSRGGAMQEKQNGIERFLISVIPASINNQYRDLKTTWNWPRLQIPISWLVVTVINRVVFCFVYYKRLIM